MQTTVPLACFLSLIRPPGVQYENALLQIVPVNKFKCPYVKNTNDVGFQLYTRHNPTVYQELMLNDDERLFASNIDFKDKTVLYFHGWMEQPEDGSAIMVREAYMQRGDTNVIMVDAHHLEAGPWYFTAAQNTWYIGKFAARFIDYLVTRGLNLNNTHLIGHSLGAHIAGVASSSLKHGRVARLTALDPALPLFENLPPEQRLDPTDAHFIDVIHTDAGIFGYKAATGHVDFYPNGGISPQPGCELEVVIPQQQLLNKCDGSMQTRGYYAYYLVAHEKPPLETKALESKLYDLFSYIHSVRTTNDLKDKNDVEEAKDANLYRILKKNTTLEVVDNKHANVKINDTKKEAKSVEYEDQIAEASEFVQTRVEYNKDALKEIETESLLTESSELVLHNDNKENNTTGMKITQDVELFNNKNHNKREDTNIIDLLKPSVPETETISVQNERHVVVTELNYKDPCVDNNNNNVHTTTDDNFENTEAPVKEITGFNIKGKIKPKINIFNVLDSTYRIGRLILSIHKNKKDKSIFDKFKIFKTTTTPKSILKQIKLKNPFTPKREKIVKRQKRFLSFLKGSETNDNNGIFRVLEFLIKNRKNVVPVFMVMREINTLVKSSNGELNHSTKEQNSYIGGATPPVFEPVSYTLELGNENKITAFLKRLVGLAPKGDRLTIGSGK